MTNETGAMDMTVNLAIYFAQIGAVAATVGLFGGFVALLVALIAAMAHDFKDGSREICRLPLRIAAALFAIGFLGALVPTQQTIALSAAVEHGSAYVERMLNVLENRE